MLNITCFSNIDDLKKLTGIDTDEGLWEAGFNLDDWDWGFCSKRPMCKSRHMTASSDWDGEEYNYEIFTDPRGDMKWLFARMDNYCVGFDHTEYDGKHYYMVHHS